MHGNEKDKIKEDHEYETTKIKNNLYKYHQENEKLTEKYREIERKYSEQQHKIENLNKLLNEKMKECKDMEIKKDEIKYEN